MALIGIDIGTSFVKGARLHPRDAILDGICRVSFPQPVAGLPPSFVEIDPRQVIEAVQQVLDQLLGQLDRCDGLLLCGQMGGMILVDSSGQPQSRYVSWRDQRACDPLGQGRASAIDEVRPRLSPQMLNELGNELRPGSCTSLLYWLKENGLSLRDHVPLSLPAFVVAQLCQTAPREHATLALGALNVLTGTWHHRALELLGLDGFRWPELHTRGPIGTCERNGHRFPCWAAVGDHQCALLGTGLDRSELSLNISTGSQVSLLSDEPRFGDWQIRPYFGGRLLNTITHVPAGRSLDALLALLTELPRRQGLELSDPWAYIREEAERAGDGELAAKLTFFDGPLGNMGSLTGLRLENLTVGCLFRAAFRNMAENYRRCADRLDPRRSWKQIVFSGGLASRIPLVKQFVLEQLPGAYRVCDHAEDTLMGLLALAREEQR